VDEVMTGPLGTAVSYCFSVVNSGSAPLYPVEIDDVDLGITDADMTLVSGDPTPPLAPGDRLVYGYESTITGDLTNTAIATGTPSDEHGVPLPGATPVADSNEASVVAAAALDPAERIAALQTTIRDYVADGLVSRAFGRRVVRLLDRALVSLARGETDRTCSILEVFANEVSYAVERGAVDPAAGEDLIDEGTAIRVELGCPGTVPEPIVLTDGFETYSAGSYPAGSGWYVEWSGESASVSADRSYAGAQSFRLSGYAGWVRTDAVVVDLSDAAALTYRVAVQCSSEAVGGAEIGFFVRTAPGESWMYNSWHFKNDHTIRVKGTGPRIGGPPEPYEVDIGRTWAFDTWYLVEARIDYTTDLVSFWLGGELVAEDMVAAPKDASSIFALANHYGADGVIYFDDVTLTIEPTP
jgi:hypothetical protein